MKLDFRPVAIAFGAGALIALPLALLAWWFLGVEPEAPRGYLVASGLGGLLGAVIGAIQARNTALLEERVRSRTEQAEKAHKLLMEESAHNRRMDEQVRQSQKLEAIGTLAGGVAHDMNNVLAGIMSLAGTIEMELFETGRPVNPEDLRDIVDACRRGRDLTTSLLSFARKGDLTRKPMSLSNAVKGMEKLVARVAPKDVHLVVDMSDDLAQIEGDPSQIRNVIMNLCINAIDAMDGTGHLTVRGQNFQVGEEFGVLEPGRYVRLEFSDDGAGMAPETLERAFDPFFTTKADGKGTGLGLSRAYGTIKEHGGNIEMASVPGGGTTVVVTFPAVDLPRQDFSDLSSAPPPRTAPGRTLLLVDDEQMIRSAGERLLERLGFHVFSAEDGVAGLEVLDRLDAKIDAVVLDMIMPRMSGEEMFFQLRQRNPDLPVLICSGYSANEAAQRLLKYPRVGFIPKPFSAGLIANELERIMQLQ